MIPGSLISTLLAIYNSSSVPSGGYRYFRITVLTNNDGSYAQIQGLRLLVGSVEYPAVDMTSNTTPAPLVASASSSYGGSPGTWDPSHAFASGGSKWTSSGGVANEWVQIDFGDGNNISPTGLKMSPTVELGRAPKTFRVEGSTTGTFTGEQTLLYNGSTTWPSASTQTFTFPIPYDIVLLFDGANGSTTFTNTGTMSLPPFTVVGSAAITTSSQISGSGSLNLPTGTDYVYTTMPTPYNPGTTPITVEFSLKKNGGGGGYNGYVSPIIFHTSDGLTTGACFYPFIQYIGKLYCGFNPSGATGINTIGLTYTISDGVLYNIAVTNDGTTWRMYINGTLVGSAAATFYGQYDHLTIGHQQSNSIGCPGLIDNVKVTIGVARYTGSSYTVNIPPALVPFRYIRFVVLSNNDNSFAQIQELRYLVGSTAYPTVDMTSNTTPSPLVASSSTSYGAAWDAWHGFSTDNAYGWTSSAGVANEWLQIDFGAGNAILPTGCRISPLSEPGRAPSTFAIYGSNTGVFAGEQVLLYNGSTTWASTAAQTFTF